MVLPLISPEYVEANKHLHAQYESYGAKSYKWAEELLGICQKSGAKTFLDYGCGKGTLVHKLASYGIKASGYDPAVDEYSARPERAEVVACTDVLEHIEPEHLEAVLDDIWSLTGRIAYLVVSTRVAKKTLPDGRNAHLIVMHSNLWLTKIMERFVVLKFIDVGQGFLCICSPKR